MGKSDLHIHTTYSMDGTATVREALESARRAGLDVIAITDHDQVRGSLEARALSTEYGVQVIPSAQAKGISLCSSLREIFLQACH